MTGPNKCHYFIQIITVFLYASAITCEITTDIERKCIPLVECPVALELVKTRKYARETIKYLTSVHCGHRPIVGPMVFCDMEKNCLTPDSKEGVCKSLYECSSFLKLIKTSDPRSSKIRNYLESFHCRNECGADIGVCCTPDVQTTTTMRLHPIHEHLLPNPNKLECGTQMDDLNKIYGGTETDVGEYPWVVLLQYATSDGKMQYGCAGSLISSRYVLTAAHCVNEELLQRDDLTLKNVILGEHDTRSESDCTRDRCADPIVNVPVEKFKMHELFNISTRANDIAIIRLKRDIQFSDYVRPICLPNKTDNMNVSNGFEVTGWGRSEKYPTSNSPVKRKAGLFYQDADECKFPLFNKEGQMCAGSTSGADTCNGDSGGPLMSPKFLNNTVVNFLYGITSFGAKNCRTTGSVYTFVPFYLDWISANLK